MFNKLYDKDDLPTGDELQNKILDVIQDNPYGKRILRNKKKTTNESFHVELRENSTDETENPCEMYMCIVHRVRGVGVTEVKGLDVQEVVAWEIEVEVRVYSTILVTLVTTTLVTVLSLQRPKAITKLLILVEAIIIIRRQNRNNVTIADSSVIRNENALRFSASCVVKRATVKLNAQQKGLSSPNKAKIFTKAATCIFRGKRQVRRTR